MDADARATESASSSRRRDANATVSNSDPYIACTTPSSCVGGSDRSVHLEHGSGSTNIASLKCSAPSMWTIRRPTRMWASKRCYLENRAALRPYVPVRGHLRVSVCCARPLPGLQTAPDTPAEADKHAAILAYPKCDFSTPCAHALDGLVWCVSHRTEAAM